MVVDQMDANNEPETGHPSRVGRVNMEYEDADRVAERNLESSTNSIPLIVLTGIIAAILMIGAMLLILPGVFEM